jgi:hypothetical protein
MQNLRMEKIGVQDPGQRFFVRGVEISMWCATAGQSEGHSSIVAGFVGGSLCGLLSDHGYLHGFGRL